jgi:hypothetical protein
MILSSRPEAARTGQRETVRACNPAKQGWAIGPDVSASSSTRDDRAEKATTDSPPLASNVEERRRRPKLNHDRSSRNPEELFHHERDVSAARQPLDESVGECVIDAHAPEREV